MRERDLHWLKVNVEDIEKSTVDSWFPAARPWVIVVDCVRAISTAQSSDWETVLLELGYEFSYFDGRNRFYIDASKRELQKVLGLVLNDFDIDQRRTQREAGNGDLRRGEDPSVERDRRLNRLRAVIAAQDVVIQRLIGDPLAELEATKPPRDAMAVELDLAKRELASVYASTSWRLTRPLRIASSAVRALVLHLIAILKRPPSASVNVLAHVVEPPSHTRWSIDADPDVLSDWKRIALEGSRVTSLTRRR
jgi:hypothetical protein